MSENEEVDFLDNDVLAVMNKNGVKITFIVCDNDALGPEPYKLLLWDESAVLVGLSYQYLHHNFNEIIMNDVLKDMQSTVDTDMCQIDDIEDHPDFREKAIDAMSDNLSKILKSLISSPKGKIESFRSASIDESISEILDS